MTEAEWNECADPQKMLEFLRSKASDRKKQLFAVGCCRRIWHLIRDQRSRTSVEVVEQFADGQATERQLREAGESAEAAAATAYHAIHDPFEAEAEASGLQPEEWVHGAWEVASVSSSAESAAFDTTALRAADVRGWKAAARAVVVTQNDRTAEGSERAAQADLLRCIFGPLPFRPIPLDPSWTAPTVKQLTEAIYEERAFDRLPVLADALEDAGCNQPDIIQHCRSGGEHIRGCWVVDLLTGRE
jgi:hypothetical protein